MKRIAFKKKIVWWPIAAIVKNQINENKNKITKNKKEIKQKTKIKLKIKTK